MKKNPSTPRNWEHLCHQRKNAVNNWTIIDRQPFEYEAVCNVAVEGKLQNGSVARLSNACASPFVPIMACCVLTLQESAGSTAGSLGLSASIILHIRHIMKKEQAERSLSIYFLQHPSLSAPLTSPWQTAQPAAVPLTADMQRGANILSLSQLTNFSDLLPQAMILSSFPAGKSHTDAPAGETRWATSQPPASPAEVTHGKPFIAPVMASPRAGLLWNAGTGPKRSEQRSRPWFISICRIQTDLSPGRSDWAGQILFPGTRTSPPAPRCSSAQPLLQHKLHCHASWNYSIRANVTGHLPGQKGENKSDQLRCDFMASCTDIHMLLCAVSLITSFQKDRQRNEWVVKHAHKNIIACLRAFVSCLWFTGPPVLHFLIICTFPMKNKHLTCTQFILISLPPHKMLKLLQPCKNGNIVVTRFIIQ